MAFRDPRWRSLSDPEYMKEFCEKQRRPLMTLPEVRKLLGRRFESVCAGGRCCPLVGDDGQRMYDRSLVERGLRRHQEQFEADEADGLPAAALATLHVSLAQLEQECSEFSSLARNLRREGRL